MTYNEFVRISNLNFLLTLATKSFEALTEANEVLLSNQKTNKYEEMTDYEFLELIDKHIKINSKDPNLHNAKAGILVKLGFLEESIECFNEAIKLSPREAAYYNNKGFALTKLKNYEKADKNYEYAIHLAPEKKEYKLFRRINSIEKQNQSNYVQSEKLHEKIEHLLNDRRNILLKIDYEIK